MFGELEEGEPPRATEGDKTIEDQGVGMVAGGGKGCEDVDY